MAEPGLFQRAADEAYVVAGAAAAAGLRHGDGEMICVVFSGQNGAHDLADDRDGGEAGVVIDVFQARVDGAAVVVAENFDVIAVFAERRAEQIEVDGGHLRREDGPMLAAHLLREDGTLIADGTCRGEDALPGAQVHGGDEAADADARRAEIRDLVDLQNGVETVALLQNLRDLVGRDGVEPAAEGVELDELELRPGADELRRRIEAGMIDPLVVCTQRPGRREVDGKRILGQHGQIVGGDELRDAVVDLRIDVVRAARQHDAAAVILLDPRERRRALRADVGLCALLLEPCGMDGGTGLRGRNAPCLFAEVSQALRGGLLVRKGEEGAQIGHTVLADGVDVIFKIFGVGDDDGTVEVVLCAGRLLMLIEHARVEDGPDTVVDEPLHMAVGQLRGIALRL